MPNSPKKRNRKLLVDVDESTWQRAQRYVARVQQSVALQQHLLLEPGPSAEEILGLLLQTALGSNQQTILFELAEIKAQLAALKGEQPE